jgi:hypothetical protein
MMFLMEPVSLPALQKDGGPSSSPASLIDSRADRTPPPRSSSGVIRRIQIVSWLFLVLAGIAQGWAVRHEIIADGISYLDIASYYARGDWHSALNGYWSPLYSWAVAALMLVFRPDPYWNVSLLHIVNFLAYLASLAGFEAILTDLLHLQRRLAGSGGFSEPTIRIVGYSVFLVASLMLIGIGYTSPDMLGMSIMSIYSMSCCRSKQERLALLHICCSAQLSHWNTCAGLLLLRSSVCMLLSQVRYCGGDTNRYSDPWRTRS